MGGENVHGWSFFDLEARVAFLQKEAGKRNVILQEDAARYIAQNFRSNARALKAALLRLILWSVWTGTPITLDYTKRILGKLIDVQGPKGTVDPFPGPFAGPRGAPAATSPRPRSATVDCSVIFWLMKTCETQKITRVRQHFEVNMREFERESLARRDVHERALEIRTKKLKRKMKF